MDNIIRDLKEICEDVRENELMKNHTTFKIGGPADIFLVPKNEGELVNIVKYLYGKDLEYFILGNGSNLLIRDKGIRGIVIYIGENLADISIEGELAHGGAGALLSTISKRSIKEGLTGMEPVSGIPGSIGGAMTMNAGAYGTEMIDIVKSVRALDRKGNIREYSNGEMHFSYRHSRVKEEDLIVLSVTFSLKKGDIEKINEMYRDFTEKRTSRQPLEKASAGSTFKRPEKGYASKMIDEAGLRGLRVNGASVSTKHTGFLINDQNATCQDVLDLIDLVKERVYEKFNVRLEREVIVLGEE